MRLQNKTAIITGGANGIGLETVLLFLEQGARVAMVDRNEEKGKQIEVELQTTYPHIRFYAADVTNRDNVQQVVQQITADFGTIDILINNAGITKDSMLKNLTEADFDQVIDVNLKGVFHFTQAVVPYFITQGSGKIVNTSSIAGVAGNIGQTNYAASKAGVIGMTKTWAKELGKKNIQVNAVAPGFIETEMTSTIPEHLKMQMQMITHSPRFGTPRDVANAYLFLSSSEADFINGHVLNIDGGMLK